MPVPDPTHHPSQASVFSSTPELVAPRTLYHLSKGNIYAIALAMSTQEDDKAIVRKAAMDGFPVRAAALASGLPPARLGELPNRAPPFDIWQLHKDFKKLGYFKPRNVYAVAVRLAAVEGCQRRELDKLGTHNDEEYHRIRTRAPRTNIRFGPSQPPLTEDALNNLFQQLFTFGSRRDAYKLGRICRSLWAQSVRYRSDCTLDLGGDLSWLEILKDDDCFMRTCAVWRLAHTEAIVITDMASLGRFRDYLSHSPRHEVEDMLSSVTAVSFQPQFWLDIVDINPAKLDDADTGTKLEPFVWLLKLFKRLGRTPLHVCFNLTDRLLRQVVEARLHDRVEPICREINRTWGPISITTHTLSYEYPEWSAWAPWNRYFFHRNGWNNGASLRPLVEHPADPTATRVYETLGISGDAEINFEDNEFPAVQLDGGPSTYKHRWYKSAAFLFWCRDKGTACYACRKHASDKE